MTRDEYDVGMCLADTRGDRADTDLGDELDVDARIRVRVLQVMDELLEVLDGVDVVMRRRRDQPDARRGVPGLGHPGIDLVTGQLTAFARFGTLRHLDLDVVGVREVRRRDTEPSGRDLLHGAASARVEQAVQVLTTLAGVALAA